jgi:hypothetical protein
VKAPDMRFMLWREPLTKTAFLTLNSGSTGFDGV